MKMAAAMGDCEVRVCGECEDESQECEEENEDKESGEVDAEMEVSLREVMDKLNQILEGCDDSMQCSSSTEDDHDGDAERCSECDERCGECSDSSSDTYSTASDMSLSSLYALASGPSSLIRASMRKMKPIRMSNRRNRKMPTVPIHDPVDPVSRELTPSSSSQGIRRETSSSNDFQSSFMQWSSASSIENATTDLFLSSPDSLEEHVSRTGTWNVPRTTSEVIDREVPLCHPPTSYSANQLGLATTANSPDTHLLVTDLIGNMVNSPSRPSAHDMWDPTTPRTEVPVQPAVPPHIRGNRERLNRTRQNGRNRAADRNRGSDIYTITRTTSPTQRYSNGRGDERLRNGDAPRRTSPAPSSSGSNNNGRSHRSEEEFRERQPSKWPHDFSAVLACLGCTLGMYNICRFAIIATQYGVSFLVQWVVLSLLLGVPMMLFAMSLGQHLGSGVLDMWRICPLFQGVGVGLLTATAILGVYTSVPIAWMFTYLRDSFVTKWGETDLKNCHQRPGCDNSTMGDGVSERVAAYFFGRVLLRNKEAGEEEVSLGDMKFEVAFNLAIVWLIVLVCLCRGIRSYGKIVYVLGTVPVLAMLLVSIELITLAQDELNLMKKQGSFSDIFRHSSAQQWVAVGREVFLTWGLHSAVILQLCSNNAYRHNLKRDAAILVLVTIGVMLLAAFTAASCLSVLHDKEYVYTPGSFEDSSAYHFLRSKQDFDSQGSRQSVGPSSSYGLYPTQTAGIKSLYAGLQMQLPVEMRARHPSVSSGYHPLRFATEVFPGSVVLLGSDKISPFWSMLFYFMLIAFGLAQQLAVWRCVVGAVVSVRNCALKKWESWVTVLSCVAGYALSLPFTSEVGIHAFFFLDSVIGSAWWLMAMYFTLVIAVVFIRGRPYGGEDLSSRLLKEPADGCLPPILAFVWSILVPAGLLVLCISSFRTGDSTRLWDWNQEFPILWPGWLRVLGGSVQILLLLIIILGNIFQTCYYLSGPEDVFDRLSMLSRPSWEQQQYMRESRSSGSNRQRDRHPQTSQIDQQRNTDPPPKYTPPPSYSTATGGRLAKMLRSSIRRSMRRFQRTRTIVEGATGGSEEEPPPPSYETVMAELRPNTGSSPVPDVVAATSSSQRMAENRPNNIVVTKAEVMTLLRSSFRNSVRRARENTDMTSVLVDSAAPVGETPRNTGDQSEEGASGGSAASIPRTINQQVPDITISLENDATLQEPTYSEA